MSAENLKCVDQRLQDSVDALREIGAEIALTGDSILIGLHEIALTAATSALSRSLRHEARAEGEQRKLH